MQMDSTRSRRVRNRHVLWFGSFLGLLQLLLLSGVDGVLWTSFLSSSQFLALAPLCYLAMAACVGFLTSWREQAFASGVNAGCMGGATGFVLMLVAGAVYLVITIATMPPEASSGYGRG